MSDLKQHIDARKGLPGKVIDRLLALYTAAYAANVRAGLPHLLACSYARAACEDFEQFVRDEAAALRALNSTS